MLKTKNYRKPPRNEAQLEERVRDTCKLNGIMRKKMSSPGSKGTLDDYFLTAGRHIWIELKMPGNTPSPLQWDEINDIRAHGGEAYWCNTLEQVCWILEHQPYSLNHAMETGGLPEQLEWMM